MVSDVRQKVSMRLHALVARLTSEIRTNPGIQTKIREAQFNYDRADEVRTFYRSEVIREFPGCRVTFSRQHITIELPKGYPNAHIPVVVQLPPAMIECLSPLGLSNKPF